MKRPSVFSCPLVLLAFLFLLQTACDAPVLQPELDLTASYAKPDKTGKPPKPGDEPTPANPAIAYLYSSNRPALWVMDEDGGNRTQLATRDQLGASVLRDPAWSPLGSGTSATDPYTVAVEAGSAGLWTVEFFVDEGGDVITSQIQPLQTGIHLARDVAYSPDGTMIAFAGYCEENCVEAQWSLYLMAVGGGAPVEVLTRHPPFVPRSPTWSPDGTAIAFVTPLEDDLDPTTNEETCQICNLNASMDGCDLVTEVIRNDWPDLVVGVDWAPTGGTESVLAVTRGATGGGPGYEGMIYTVEVTRDPEGWSRTAGEDAVYRFQSENPSWSPTSDRIVADGLNVFDMTTQSTSRSTKGYHPDWRPPAPSGF
jgi:Tol biopolymer transport system component